MLALKLFLVPFFLALISLAGKRWGPRVAGWLTGLPVVSGPILFFLAMEQGAPFAVEAASMALAGIGALLAFCVVYAHACRRLHWVWSVLAGLAAWFIAALLLSALPSSAFISLGTALIALIAAPRLFPPAGSKPAAGSGDRRELAVRMLAGALITVLVTATAAFFGSTWSGMFAAFPVIGTVLAVFSHRAQGADFVIALLRAMPAGFYSFAAFSFTLSLALIPMGLALAFGAAALAAALVQVATGRRLAAPARA